MISFILLNIRILADLESLSTSAPLSGIDSIDCFFFFFLNYLWVFCFFACIIIFFSHKLEILLNIMCQFWKSDLTPSVFVFLADFVFVVAAVC